MKYLLITGIGGAIGTMCRWLVQVGIGRYMTIAWPLGTFVVNVSGCFVIGLLYGLSNKYAWMTMEWRLLLITGICGGYTTFSSYAYESISLIRQGNYFYFFSYVLCSVIVGLLATVGGVALIR
ncbi:MAG TPA: fluoride efflux transporter CrcB [Puia sp.]|nr:fluoride efflux transporter CrcB [Puia sp.]